MQTHRDTRKHPHKVKSHVDSQVSVISSCRRLYCSRWGKPSKQQSELSWKVRCAFVDTDHVMCFCTPISIRQCAMLDLSHTSSDACTLKPVRTPSQAQYIAKDGEECDNIKSMPDNELYLMAQVSSPSFSLEEKCNKRNRSQPEARITIHSSIIALHLSFSARSVRGGSSP